MFLVSQLLLYLTAFCPLNIVIHSQTGRMRVFITIPVLIQQTKVKCNIRRCLFSYGVQIESFA